MFVRWLGWHSVVDARTFDFEFTRDSESCAEELGAGTGSELAAHNPHVWVGLLCSERGVVRRFPHDAWSKLRGDRLCRGKGGRHGEGYKKPFIHTHTEAWVKPGHFVGIVLVGSREWIDPRVGFVRDFAIDCCQLDKARRKAVAYAAKRYGVPVYRLVNGVLKRAHL